MNPENIGATAKPTECALSESKAIASNCWPDTVKYAAAPRRCRGLDVFSALRPPIASWPTLKRGITKAVLRLTGFSNDRNHERGEVGSHAPGET